MLDWFSLGWFRFGIDLSKSAWRFLRRNKRSLTPSEKIAARQRWKNQFEEYIYKNKRKKLRLDAIMRDVRRVDEYPDGKVRAKGISPWFRFGMVDTYERGFMAALRGSELVKDATTGRWRHVNALGGERGKYFVCIGFVPYEMVDNVDWHGDQYYDYPHVFCYFDGWKEQPYERIAYCEEWEFDGITHYREILDYKDVVKESRRHGLKVF